ncbi:hypothetical protein [Kitasatospora sp. McL0602]|uniref:hypothetical protein n=1 Tax=Kitasatospora sp. McL0602 TaxID=3439530 RepID=UPI003F8CBF52
MERMTEVESTTEAGMLETLLEFLKHDVPQQFAPSVLLDTVARTCARLGLPAPVIEAGNIVVGDLPAAGFVLSAHLDEASFSVTGVHDSVVTLSACHRFDVAAHDGDAEPLRVSFLGIRDGEVRALGSAPLQTSSGGLSCAYAGDIRLGDRAVYTQQIGVSDHLLSAKAIDDRLGAVIALYAAARIDNAATPVALVFSDGEQNRPDGYFSRTFPQILGKLRPDATVVFVDGIFQDGLERERLDGPQPGVLVVPHSADGMGYTVPPKLFAALRDDIIPAAVATGIDVRVSGAYHSRGDDWGMVTNPTSGVEREAFFVSFGGWGQSPAGRVVDTRSLGACVAFIAFAVREVGGK